MSNVVISNRNITNQKIISIEQNKTLLPFNLSKEQVNKLIELLNKVKVTFLSEPDKLNIGSLTYNDINVKPGNRQLNNSKFTLSKTYVVTMKQTFVSKVKNFYERLVENKIPERPIFNINKETNLQEALKEATAEIDLSTINASLNNNQNIQNNTMEQPSSQVLANNPLGETIIENPVNLNNPQPVNVTPTPIDNNSEIANVNPYAQQPENNMASPVQQTVSQEIVLPVSETTNEQGKTHVKKLKGNILTIPIVVIWLGLVFFGTLKLVTNILT